MAHPRSARQSRLARPPLQVDRRQGSADLLPLLKRLGLPAVLADLRYTGEKVSGPDFQFTGNGPLGLTPIVIERKKVSELLGCLRGENRLTSRQIPGMIRTTPYRWLLVEGRYWPGREGELMVYGGDAGFTRDRYSYAELEAFLLTLQLHGQVQIAHTNGAQDTALWLHTLYRWWQKRWIDHKSLCTIDEATITSPNLLGRKVSAVRKVAAQFPGIYWVRSRAVEHRFKTVVDVVTATRAEWAEVEGVGPKTARRVWRWLRGLEEEP